MVNKMDQEDLLYDMKSRFFIQENEYYMDGNSLGLMSKDAKEKILEVMNDWASEGIKIWGIKDEKYFLYPQIIGSMMAPLINAKAEEVIALGSITSNIHQALSTFYQPTKERYKILVDDLNFPTDRYAIQSLLDLKGYPDGLKTVASIDGRTIDEDHIIESMTDDVALILLPAVLYRSAQLFNMKKISQAASDRNIIIGWDLAHSIGAVDHNFMDIQADFAVWCTYKYLNGGPGSVAGLYINEKHFDKKAGLRGWFGNRNETQFLLSNHFDQSLDASGHLQGTPHILSLAGLEGSLGIFQETGLQAIRRKSLKLTAYLMDLIDEHLSSFAFTIGNPRQDHKRGGHICLEHDEAYRISLAMRDAGVIPDFREPNVIRLAPVALYTHFSDLDRVVKIIHQIYDEGLYKKYSNKRASVV